MNHLIISREYPPAPYSAGGIGTYVDHISRLLAEHGEVVHVIAQRWPGAPRAQESYVGGRLVVHRVPLDEPLPFAPMPQSHASILEVFQRSRLPSQAFLWQAAQLAESLIESAAIDAIEGQEYEAPLYFLLLRRALNLSTRRVPVIAHLHSPTELIFEQNGWDRSRPDYAPLKQFEDFTIRAADGLLCPSRFLARIAEAHYRLEAQSIDVIPHPLGDTHVLTRTERTWRDGTLCYVGRLEPRKGVAEWAEAATAVARDAGARFAFIGADTSPSGMGDLSMRELLLARIPPQLQPQFTFVNAVPRPQLAAHLQRARIAVVPSRWENFPYSCIEAMASGLPVLVSPMGGMAEMVDDGRTGWIADGSDPKSLETALRRALATPSRILEEMGSAAAASIQQLCDSKHIARRHIEFRRAVVNRGCRSSSTIAQRTGFASDDGDTAAQAARRITAAFPALAACSAADISLLRHAALQPAIVDGAASAAPPHLGERTLSPLEILRATRPQQLAVVRRALGNPGYIGRWLAWHGRRTLIRLSQRVQAAGGIAFKGRGQPRGVGKT